VGRLAGGNEQNPVETKLPERLLGERQMPEMRRIERRPEDANGSDRTSTPS
jgi:hypothetical protein